MYKKTFNDYYRYIRRENPALDMWECIGLMNVQANFETDTIELNYKRIEKRKGVKAARAYDDSEEVRFWWRVWSITFSLIHSRIGEQKFSKYN